MNVAKSEYKTDNLNTGGYLQKVSAEQKEYEESPDNLLEKKLDKAHLSR